MTIQVQPMERIFKFNGVRLPDPNLQLDIEGVRDVYASQYPELASASVRTETVKDRLLVTFEKVIGHKG